MTSEQTRRAHAVPLIAKGAPAAPAMGARRRPAVGPLWPYGRAYPKLPGLSSEMAVRPDELIASIRTGPQGPRVIAAFDFDGTLVSGCTSTMLTQRLLRGEDLRRGEIAKKSGHTLKKTARVVKPGEFVAGLIALCAGTSEEEMEELGALLYEDAIQDMIFPEMRDLVAAHRQAGHTIVVATSASRFQLEATAEALGIDHLLCTKVEVEAGKLTGKVAAPPMWGNCKAEALKNFVVEHDGTLAETHFYAGGDVDTGIMQAVGNPHPTNPTRKLADAARTHGWSVLRLSTRGSAKPIELVRGVAGLMSIVPIVQYGVLSGKLKRDKRSASNQIMPAWIQVQLELAGVKLRVAGRENLSLSQPAVFIFNHRNNFDPLFVAGLVGTDYVTVAKKEMSANPIGKLVTTIMPTILVDREATSAAATLRQVAQAINEGYSIIVAPEGTRVRGNPDAAGPFMKGAFHMAMVARVPIVPVVIRNALDVASRDGAAMRPGTVDVAVLPQIFTEHWSRANLGEKLRQVRETFNNTLQNWPDPDV